MPKCQLKDKGKGKPPKRSSFVAREQQRARSSSYHSTAIPRVTHAQKSMPREVYANSDKPLLTPDLWRRSLLFQAIARRNVDYVRMLVDRYKVNLNTTAPGNDDNMTALHVACSMTRNGDMIEYLIENGVDLNARTVKQGTTVLMTAILNRNLEIIPKLIRKYDFDLTLRDAEQRTLLHYCAQYGYVDTLRFLLHQHEIDVNARDQNGWTALHWASVRCFELTVRELLDYMGGYNGQVATNVNMLNKQRQSALYMSCALRKNEPIVRLLLARGACPDIVSKTGCMAIDIAREANNANIVEILEVYRLYD